MNPAPFLPHERTGPGRTGPHAGPATGFATAPGPRPRADRGVFRERPPGPDAGQAARPAGGDQLPLLPRLLLPAEIRREGRGGMAARDGCLFGPGNLLLARVRPGPRAGGAGGAGLV